MPLLADESVTPAVVAGLRESGADVSSVMERGLGGRSDLDVLRAARREDRVVLTHDRDFGTLAIRGGEAIVGVIYLRPGHTDAVRVLQQIDAVLALDIDAHPPFVLVAQRRGDQVRVRLRQVVTPG